MTLRRRVALAAAAATLLSVALLGAVVQLLLARELHDRLDGSLRGRAADIAALSASAPALVSAPGTLEASLGGSRAFVEVLDRRGRIVARSLGLGGRLLPLGPLAERALARGRPGYADATLGDESLRVYVAPLADLGGGPAAGGAVVVAGSTAEISGTLSLLRRLTLLTAVAAAVLGALAAALLTRRALRPVERLSAAAADIARTGDAGRRLPAPPSDDEVGRLADALNAMLAALERAREAERRFVADASHELRTPLTALRGNASYVARHGADREVLADIEADAARLARLLDDLLALAREDAAERPRGSVRLDGLARAAAEREPRVRVRAPEPVTVRGDADALARALENLVGNALRYGPEDGEVIISAEARDGRALLAVRDEGQGLPPGSDRAFDRFWRGPNAAGREGSGLGLAIVRSTAERHGGAVRVDGPCFTIDLPLAPPS